MKLHRTSAFQLVFCDASENLFPAGCLENLAYPLDLTHSPYDILNKQISTQHISEQQVLVQKTYNQDFSSEPDSVVQTSTQQDSAQKAFLNSVVLLKQTHSTQGFGVTAKNIQNFTTAPRQEGDFLCTTLPGIGIGVLTADCLPMAFYDPVNHAAAIVHAGWRGTVEGIGEKTLRTMHDSFGTCPKDVQVFIGPCAKSCCYQVSEDFVQQLTPFLWADKVFEYREQGLYFNLPLCNSLLLQDAGVDFSSISYVYNECTICNHSFCSYRRDAAASCRQLSLIVLS